MDHDFYQKKVRTMDDSALRFVIQDCAAALEAWPDQPNAGYYADEIHYCAMELKRRRQ
jgi:hypothetical protein